MKWALLAAACGLVAGQSVAQNSPPAQTGRASAGAAAQPSGTVSFRKDLLPLFRDSCTMCHQGEIPMGELSLTPDSAYDNLVGVQAGRAAMDRVAPGKPDKSYLYYKISGRNAEVKGGGFGMPWGAALAPVEVDLVRRWIRQGARND